MTQSNRSRARLDNAFQQQNWAMVRHRAAMLLRDAPEDAGLQFMAGVAELQTGQLARAVEVLGKAASLEPERPDYLAQYARALAGLRRLRDACEVADRAMGLPSQDPKVAEQLGHVYLQAQELERACEAFLHAMTLRPGHAPYRLQLGSTLASLGDTSGAERHLETCIEIEPRLWPAHLSLARLRKQTPETQHLDRLRALLTNHSKDRGAQIFLNMALGKECEDLDAYSDAFSHFTRGKATARSMRPPSAERDHRMFESLVNAFPAPMPLPDRHATPDPPIFIIGMPRTGTTLLNRVISSHPEVVAAGELQTFPTILQLASGSPIALLSQADIVAHTQDIDWTRLGADYIENARPADAKVSRFIDDMPHNFLYAGFIARALPNARILCMRRDPLDTCLGNFRHLFNLDSGFYDYTLDLLDIGRYFIQFDRLMAHWRAVLPGRILEVSYEALVQDPEAMVRKVLAICGLPWNDDCLRIENNTAPVNTPSAWQLRSPIYTSAVGRWRNYEKQIQPLRELLAQAGITGAMDQDSNT